MATPRSKYLLFSMLGLLVATQPSLASQDAYGILLRVSTTYRLLNSFHFTCRTTTDMVGERVSSKTNSVVVFAGAKPDKIRVELQDPGINMSLVSDGSAVWTYMPHLEEYTRTSPIPFLAGWDTVPSNNPAISALKSHFDRYQNVLRGMLSASMVGDEVIGVQGARVDCVVIDVKYKPRADAPGLQELSRTLWIDKARAVVVQERARIRGRINSGFGDKVENTLEMSCKAEKLNESIAEDLFVFSPPASFKEVEETKWRTKSAPEADQDETAPDFSLTDASGAEVSLSGFRGKLVLLAFVADWCSECVDQLAVAHRFAQKLSEKDTGVLAVTASEFGGRSDHAASNTWLTLLLDPEYRLFQGFRIGALPTLVIIDRRGKIVRRHVGLWREAEIEAALTNIGGKKERIPGTPLGTALGHMPTP